MHTAAELLIRRGRLNIARSIAYGKGRRGTLDVYQPPAAAAAPVVVFFYGGAWQSGNKQIYRFVGVALARRGYVAILPDYRIFPEVRYPDFLEDGSLAVRWVKENVARFGGDPNKLFLMGHSAGAHIAAMLSLDKRWLEQVSLAPNRDIAGLIGISGPYDFLPLRDGPLKAIFGDDPATQPISHVAPGAPPALLLTGVRDGTVDPGNSSRLVGRLHAAGVAATLVTYSRVGHFLIIAAFARAFRVFAPILQDIDTFIARTVTHAPGAKCVEIMR
jgi:acetyl esterase/lipase